MLNKKGGIRTNFADTSDYEQRIRRFVPYYDEMLVSLLTCLPKTRGKRKILELGCGTGNLTQRILESQDLRCLIAIDLVEEMIKTCRTRFQNEQPVLELICADLTSFLRPGAFDFALSSLAFHYPESCEQKVSSLRCVFRSLKPGGIFSFSCMLSGETEEFTTRAWRAWEDDVAENGVTPSELEAWYRTNHLSDHPVPSSLWLRWLNKIGFRGAELAWRRTIFGTFWAKKSENPRG